MTPIVAQIPIVDDIVESAGSITGGAAGWGFEQVAEGIARWVLGAVSFFVEGVVDFLLNSSSPNLTSAWFSGAGSPFATVRNIAGLMLLAFLFLGLIQGLMAGDVGGMVRRVAMDLPMAIIGMAATTIVVDRLLALTDALSATVLQSTDAQAVNYLAGFGVTVSGLSGGFAAVILGLMAIIAGFLVWIELMVRSVLVYVIVALSPLAFAATVWPSARGVLRRMVELLVAVIFSKLVIAIAISVGVAALSGATATPPDAPLADDLAAGMGNLFVGTAVLGMAALSPFLLLKLIPMAEAALVAQGVSRAPIRGAQSTMSNVYHAQSIGRLAGGSSSGSANSSGNSGSGTAKQTAPWAVGAGAPPSSAISTGATGSSATSTAAAAGPAGVAVATGTTVLSAGTGAIGKTSQAATDAAAPTPHVEPRRKPNNGSQQ
ncbi:MAG: hypothetical protein R2733_17270 [Acidimicrobiales bacterium]